MSAEPVREEEHDEQLQEMIRLVRVLAIRAPAELARLFTSRGLGDDVRRAAEAMAAFPVPAELRWSAGVIQSLTSGLSSSEPQPLDSISGEMIAQVKHAGSARKVSVSMPQDLTSAVQRRVGRGKFSQYVTEAVARQFELDLLTELLELLTSEHGPVPESDLAEARAAWPAGE